MIQVSVLRYPAKLPHVGPTRMMFVLYISVPNFKFETQRTLRYESEIGEDFDTQNGKKMGHKLTTINAE